MPTDTNGRMGQSNISQYFECHREGGENIVDPTFLFGQNCQFLTCWAKIDSIQGSSFSYFELFEQKCIAECANVVKLEHTVLSTHS